MRMKFREMSNQETKEELSESGIGIGVEADSDSLIIEPFDPESISIDQKSVPMDTLIRRLKQKTIKLNPSFQRNEVWDDERRSRLIESIMLKIPLPMFYVASDEEGRWEVVDGLQRLSTIRNFIFGSPKGQLLVLKDLEFLGTRLNGKTFKDISEDISQQRLVNTIMETEMRFTVINPGTPEAVKRNIFKRINTGGLPLTSQEIRHALYQGPVTDLLIDLVESIEFKEAIGGSINDSRMGMRELIMYFLAFLVFPRNAYKGSVDGWLSNAMRVINHMPELSHKNLLRIFPDGEVPEINYKTIEELREKFALAMVRARVLFGDYAFRKSLPGNGRKTPVNKALFETWSTILCELSEEDFSCIYEKRHVLLRRYKKILTAEVLGSMENYYADLLDFSAEMKHNYFNTLRSSDTDVSFLFSIEKSQFPYLSNDDFQQLNALYSGSFLDNSISRNSSEVESAQRRHRLIKNLIKTVLLDNS